MHEEFKFMAVFVPHVPTAPGTCKKVEKANLSRLGKPADLSLISPAILRLASGQLSKPADDGPHNSAWGLVSRM